MQYNNKIYPLHSDRQLYGSWLRNLNWNADDADREIGVQEPFENSLLKSAKISRQLYKPPAKQSNLVAISAVVQKFQIIDQPFTGNYEWMHERMNEWMNEWKTGPLDASINIK